MGNKKEKPKTNKERIPPPLFKSFSHVGRHWCKKSLPEHVSKTKNTNFEFTVASYNVLADKLMKDNPYLYYEGMARNPMVFEWQYRKHNLLKEIVHANPDILCLQEVQEEHYYNWFNPQLQQRGYTSVYKKRSGSKSDGCAVFYKRSKFSLQLCHVIDFHRKSNPWMDRNNVAIILLLVPCTTGSCDRTPICIATTHILFNKKRGDIKLTQLAHLFADMDALVKMQSPNYKYAPIIMCGDFNMVPGSPIYRLITSGELAYKGLSKNIISGQIRKQQNEKCSEFKDDFFPLGVGISNYCKWIFNSSNSSNSCEMNISNKIVMSTEKIPKLGKRKYELNRASDGSSSSNFGDHRRILLSMKNPVVVIVDSDDSESSLPIKFGNQNVSNRMDDVKNNSNAVNHSRDSLASDGVNINCSCIDRSIDGEKKGISLFSGSPIVVISDSDDSESSNNEALVDCDNSESSLAVNCKKNINCRGKPGFLTHEFSFQSSYSHYDEFGNQEITTCQGSDSCNVDYIFYSAEVPLDSTKNRLFLSGVLSLLTETELYVMGKLPNSLISSDHLLLMSSFVLKS